MPRKSLSQRIVEALELAERLRKVSEKLPPEIKETVMRYSQVAPKRRKRRSVRRRGAVGRPRRKTESTVG
ncbi:MAG: hypothetical protein QXH59_06500 [Candidatus Caldarchaeum sp.]